MKKKNLYITTALKGGVGKSTVASLIPIIQYKLGEEESKNDLKFNIVEIDDTKTEITWKSERIRYKKFEVFEHKDAIVEIQRTYADSNVIEILDLGGGYVKTKSLLEHIAKMRLDEIFNLHFIVPTNRTRFIFDSTKATLELIYSLFDCQSTLVYNKVVNNVNEEFHAFFGNQKWNLKSRFQEIDKYIKDEIVVYDDIFSLLDNAVTETGESTLDFFINSEYIVNNWIEYRLEALNSGDQAINDAMMLYDISYDFLEFFKKIKFEVAR